MTTYLANHGEYLVSGRMNCQNNDPSSSCPLSEVLHQEEGVEDVHTVRGLVQDHDVSVQLKVTGHV